MSENVLEYEPYSENEWKQRLGEDTLGRPPKRYRCTVEGLVFISENHFQRHAKRAHMEIVER